jgi:hypothetical protein
MQPAQAKPKLLDQLRDVICTRHCIRTERAYGDWAPLHRVLSDAPSGNMGPTEIAQFLTQLAVKNNVAASTQNQAFNAILFLYREC